MDLIKPQADPSPKPANVKIKSVAPVILPGAMAGSISLIIFGLGDNDEMYQWSTEKRKWYEQ